VKHNGSATDRLISANNAHRPQSRFTLAPCVPIDDYVRRSMGSAPFAFTLTPTVQGKAESTNPFVDNWTVYVCTRALARAAGAVRLKLWRTSDPEAEEVPESDPVSRLLARPNRDMDWMQFAAAGMVHRKLSGEDVWFLADERGEPVIPSSAANAARLAPTAQRVPLPLPVQIIPVIGTAASDLRDTNGRIMEWWYSGVSMTSKHFPAESVIHFADYDPSDPQRGIGDVEIAKRHVDTAFQAERYQDGVMRGGGPGAYLINKEGQTDPDETARNQEAIDAKTRDPDQSRRTKILTGDWDVIANPVSPKDMLVLDHLKYSRDVIASTMGVPLPIIGVLENATYSNMAEAWKQFWLGVADYLKGVANTINEKFLANLADPAFAQYRVSFDFDEIDALKEDQTKRYELAANIASKGVGVSFDDVAAQLDLDWVPTQFSGVVLVPAGMVPLDSLGAGNAAPALDANGMPIDPAVMGSTNVADTALNGAQIAALVQITEAVSSGLLSEDGAVAMILVAFPTIDEPEARRIVQGVNAKEAAPATETPSAAKPAKELSDLERGFFSTSIPPLADAERREYARSFETRVLRAGDRRIYRPVLRWLTAYEQASIARLRDFAQHGQKALGTVTKISTQDIDALLVEREAKWSKLLGEYTGPSIANVFSDAVRDAASERGSTSIPMTSPRVQGFLSRQTIQLSEGVTSTVTKRVRAAILDVIGEPATIGDLQLAVRDKLPELTDELAAIFGTKEARALTIARTESAHAANGGKFAQYEADGVEEVQWVSAHDDAVRESHKELDGRVVSYGTEFKKNLRYPSDEHGPASEVINCRCTLLGLKADDPKP
jgi:SPP1 gp7 family putative phage head morphogenesis protein